MGTRDPIRSQPNRSLGSNPNRANERFLLTLFVRIVHTKDAQDRVNTGEQTPVWSKK